VKTDLRVKDLEALVTEALQRCLGVCGVKTTKEAAKTSLKVGRGRQRWGEIEKREQVRRREGSRVRAEQGERSGAGPGRVSRDGTQSILYVVVKFAPIQLSWWSNL